MIKAERKSVREEAIGHYNELLQDTELRDSSLKSLEDAMEETKLIFGGRKLSPYLRPDFVLESDWETVKEIGETVFQTLQKVKDEAVRSDKMLDELGITDIERDWISINPGYSQVSPTARLDSFLADDAYSYVELNGESPAGIAYADSARDIFMDLPIVKKFAESYEFSGLEGRSHLLSTLLQCYEEYLGKSPQAKPVFAIVDLKDLPTVKEFELCKEYFESNGYQAIICSPDELEFTNGKLYAKGEKIDIVYRRLLINEYIPIVNEYPALIDAYRAGAICMANSVRAKIIHKKAIFAILTNEKFADLFTVEELETIRKHIPWTRMFRQEKTKYYDKEIDLIEWTRANRDKLALKPNDDYGGHGIYIGWVANEAEWDDAISHALEVGDYLVQERVKTAKEIFPYIDQTGEIHMVNSMVDLDPLLFNGKAHSAFTRLSTTELANVTSGGGMVPTFILKGKK